MQPSKTGLEEDAIRAALRARAGGAAAVGFDVFMEVALYQPGAGYYRKPGPRVGYGPGTDFLTATASAPLFGRLVAGACAHLLGPAAAASDFVEIGAEPEGGILGQAPHPFRSQRHLRVGEPLVLRGPSVVFSNELFDAQPFRRFVFRSGGWRELGVSWAAEILAEVEIGAARDLPVPLPEAAPEGYRFDAPLAAAALARAIADQPWTGLFVAFDYGKSWEELATATPAGTARSYRRHAQSNDLLAHPGEQDLTCHVCWDWLGDALRSRGFRSIQLESQEAFFARHAGHMIAEIAAAGAAGLNRDKLSLLQLLHPAHLGQKYQVLWGIRGEPAP
jgi:SAM-dependent MidA family methyltransferase